MKNYYTVEFRRQDGWSAGIPADVVLIHEVKRNRDAGGNLTGPQIAWLQRDLSRPDKAPAQTLDANGVRITVVSTNAAANQAVVRVRSEMSGRCLMGFVWRRPDRTTACACLPLSVRKRGRRTGCTAPGSLDNRLPYAARLKVCSSHAARASSGLRWPFFSSSHSAL